MSTRATVAAIALVWIAAATVITFQRLYPAAWRFTGTWAFNYEIGLVTGLVLGAAWHSASSRL